MDQMNLLLLWNVAFNVFVSKGDSYAPAALSMLKIPNLHGVQRYDDCAPLYGWPVLTTTDSVARIQCLTGLIYDKTGEDFRVIVPRQYVVQSDGALLFDLTKGVAEAYPVQGERALALKAEFLANFPGLPMTNPILPVTSTPAAAALETEDPLTLPTSDSSRLSLGTVSSADAPQLSALSSDSDEGSLVDESEEEAVSPLASDNTPKSIWMPKKRKTAGLNHDEKVFPPSMPAQNKAGVFSPSTYFPFKEFASLAECEAWLKNTHLQCNIHRQAKAVNQYGSFTTAFHCAQRAERFPGLQKKFSTKNQREGVVMYQCPWVAKARTDVVTSKTVLYMPHYDGSVFENICNHRGAVFQAGNDEATVDEDTVLLPGCRTVVSRGGHVHTSDGSGLTRAPDFVKAVVDEAFADKDVTAAKLRLMQREDYDLYQNAYDKCLEAEFKNLKHEAKIEPETQAGVRKLMEKALSGKCVFNKIAEHPTDAMFFTVHHPTLGALNVIGVRAGFEILLRSRFWYCDSTHSLVPNSTVKVLGIMSSDAVNTPFPLCFLPCPTEEKITYQIMFDVVEKIRVAFRDSEPDVVSRDPLAICFDGVKGMAELVERVFGPMCARTSCYYHVDASVLKTARNTLHLLLEEQEVMKRLVRGLGRAHSLAVLHVLFDKYFGVLALTDSLKECFKRVFEWYVQYGAENVGFFGAFCVRYGDVNGPIGSRCNNVIESIWASFTKFLLRQLPGNLPVNDPTLAVAIAKFCMTFPYQKFRDSFDVIESEEKKAMDWKYAAMYGLEVVLAAHRVSRVPMPTLQHRFFFISFKTGLLLPLDEAVMQSLVSEVVDQRGWHRGLSKEELMAEKNKINADLLWYFHNNGYIVQFRLDHMPGTAYSFRFADCECPDALARRLCIHALLIHRYFLRERINKGDLAETMEEEMSLWPKIDAFEKKYKIKECGDRLAFAGFTGSTVEEFDAPLQVAREVSAEAGPDVESEDENRHDEEILAIKKEWKDRGLSGGELFKRVGGKRKKTKTRRPGSVRQENDFRRQEANRALNEVLSGRFLGFPVGPSTTGPQ